MNKQLTLGSFVLAACAALAPVAFAFPAEPSWHEAADATNAGAGGNYYTGGQRDHGLVCASCHTGSTGSVSLTLVPTPSFPVVGGVRGYSPGTAYAMTLSLVGAHLGSGSDDMNGMTFTAEDASARTVGRFASDSGQTSAACPPSAPTGLAAGTTTLLYGDCHGVLPRRVPSLTSWHFTWTAPAAGTGAVDLFAAAVDGDHDGHSCLGDDATQLHVHLVEGP